MEEPSGDVVEWFRHFDDESGHYYWYNEQSKESKWDELHEKNTSDDLQSMLLIGGVESSSLGTENDIPTADEIRYIRFLLVNAVVFEAAMCVIECIIRCIILGTLLIVIYVSYCCTILGVETDLWSLEGIIRRDFVLSAAAMLTLMVPGFVLFIYREHETIGGWSLSPIPTILGKVDSRRFATITMFGLGSLSLNAYGSTSHTHNCHDCWESSLLFYPKDYLHSLAG